MVTDGCGAGAALICVRAWRSLFGKAIVTGNQREGHVVSGIANEFWAMVWLVSLALIPLLFLLLMFKPRPFQLPKDREPSAMREALSPGELAGRGTITSDLRLHDTSGDSPPPAWTVRMNMVSSLMFVVWYALDHYFEQIADSINLCEMFGR